MAGLVGHLAHQFTFLALSVVFLRLISVCECVCACVSAWSPGFLDQVLGKPSSPWTRPALKHLVFALKHLVFALNSPRVRLGLALDSPCVRLELAVSYHVCNCRFFRWMQVESAPNALHCLQMHRKCKANALQLRQDFWESCEWPNKNATCTFLSAVAKIKADSGECQANAKQNAQKASRIRNLMVFFGLSRVRVTNSCMCDRGFRVCQGRINI